MIVQSKLKLRNNTKEELANLIHQGGSNLESCINVTVSELVGKIGSKLSDVQKSNDESAEIVMRTSKEQTDKLLKENKEQTDKILGKIASLTTQNEGMTSMLKETANVAKMAENCMSDINEQCEKINKGVASVEIKAQNIEKAVSLVNGDNSKKEIVNSFRALITELKDDLRNEISDINNQILDSQINQETTNNELNKLQVLLSTVLRSLENHNSKTTQVTPPVSKQVVGSKQPKQKSATTSPPATQVNHTPAPQPVKPTSSSVPKINPNRTETIVDEETKNIVQVEYKDGKLMKSTMKDTKGHLIYELEYVNNRIARSRNYDGKGNLTVEQTYYDNGQVHYRNEYTKNGKKTTEFEINGNKK